MPEPSVPPEPPPEAGVLRSARILQQLSVREAAHRAGVSTSLWRQVEAGYATPAKGVHTPKIAPAATLAYMARAVDLQPDDLESKGHRLDAAAILREIYRQQPPGPGLEDFPDVSPDLKRAIAAHLPEILGRLEVVRGMDSSARITGEMMFPPHVRDPRARERNRRDAERWDNVATVFGWWKPESVAMGVAVMRADAEADKAEREKAERDKAEQDGYATG